MPSPPTVLSSWWKGNRRLDGSSSYRLPEPVTFSFRTASCPSLSEALQGFCNRHSSKLLFLH